MYFLVALGCSIISAILWFIFRNKKELHLDILCITFSAATIMWLIDVIFTAIEGEAPLTFEAQDAYISLWTFLGAIGLWLVLTLILFLINKKKTQQAN